MIPFLVFVHGIFRDGTYLASFKAVVVRDFDGLQSSCSVFEHGCRTRFRARVFATVALALTRSSFASFAIAYS